jgi:hypothetical protein
VQRGPDVFDRELDPQPQRPAGLNRDTVVPFQRLVVNPFLAVLVFVIIVALWREAVIRRMPVLFQLGMGLLVVDALLVQYHCLDCGATGWLLRYRRHACSRVLSRWQHGEWRRFRGPGVKIQLVAWLIIVAGAFVLMLILWIAD